MPHEQLLNHITLAWMGVAVVAFIFCLWVTQPYGRHTTTGWGPMMSNRWGWIVQEAPSMLFLSIFFFTGSVKNPVNYFFWGLWMLHYVNRTFIFPFRIKTQGKQIPVVIVCSAICFNFMNGSLNGYWLGNDASHADAGAYFTSARFIVGILLFINGFAINNWADTILINLRKPGETGYKIPTGGLFNYISCPNHFGEIIEWLGFAVMINSLPAWSFALWAFCNLVPRALDHQKWYRKKFADYPKERKAVIPFVL